MICPEIAYTIAQQLAGSSLLVLSLGTLVGLFGALMLKAGDAER